jgi:hypothetical protein
MRKRYDSIDIDMNAVIGSRNCCSYRLDMNVRTGSRMSLSEILRLISGVQSVERWINRKYKRQCSNIKHQVLSGCFVFGVHVQTINNVLYVTNNYVCCTFIRFIHDIRSVAEELKHWLRSPLVILIDGIARDPTVEFLANKVNIMYEYIQIRYGVGDVHCLAADILTNKILIDEKKQYVVELSDNDDLNLVVKKIKESPINHIVILIDNVCAKKMACLSEQFRRG